MEKAMQKVKQQIMKKELEQIYEAVAGDNAINRYTHEEILQRILDMYDAEQLLQEATSDEYIELINRRGQ